MCLSNVQSCVQLEEHNRHYNIGTNIKTMTTNETTTTTMTTTRTYKHGSSDKMSNDSKNEAQAIAT